MATATTTAPKPPKQSPESIDAIAAQQAELYRAVESLILSMRRAEKIGKTYPPINTYSSKVWAGTAIDFVRNSVVSASSRRTKTRQAPGRNAKRHDSDLTRRVSGKQPRAESFAAELAKFTAEVNAKIAAIDKEHSEAQSVVARHINAISHLRTLAPAHVKHEVNHVTSKASGQFAEAVSNARAAVELAEKVSTMEIGSLGGSVDAGKIAEGHNPELLVPKKVAWEQPRVDPRLWKIWADKLRDNIPARRNHLRDMLAQQAKAAKEAENSLLDYHVPT